MAFSHSPKIATDGLVFYYDTGNGKSYKGEPTTNLIPGVANPTLSTTGWSEDGWSGAIGVDTEENAIVLTATNGWHSINYDFGVLNSPITVRFKAKLKSKQTTTIPLHVVNGRHLGDYDQWLGSIPTPTLSEYQEFTATFTPTSRSLICLILRGADTLGLTDEIYIKDLQVEQKDHATQFVNGTRSVTEGLLDLTKNSTLDLSNAGFNSSAELDFDGTNDYVESTDITGYAVQAGTLEALIFPTQTGADQMVVGLGGTQTTGADRIIRVYGDQWSWATYGSSAQDWNQIAPVSFNTWNHIVGIWNNTAMRFYINGVEYQNTKEIVTPIEARFRVGTSTWNTPERFFGGKVDSVKFYDRALTADEVAQNYNAIKNRFGI